jgi:GDP-L-fucose synthase
MSIIVTGGSGMVGRSLEDISKKYNKDFIFLSSKDCDLTKVDEVDNLFKKINPDYIIHLAANVGGLYKNLRERTRMFKDNVRINENVLEMCHKYNVQRGIFCLSSCIFPYKPSKFPMNETMMHESEPHPSNEGYAYSKRMLEMQCRNYNEQYGREYICLIPVNLYGPYDNFSLEDSHVIPGLIHRLYLSKKNNTKFSMFGSGKPLRQFIYSYDFSRIILKTLFEYKDTKSIICCDSEITIKDLTYLIAKYSDYDINNIGNDISKSDGCLKKTVDGSYLKLIFPEFKYISLEEGIKKTIEWFNKNYEKCRK